MRSRASSPASLARPPAILVSCSVSLAAHRRRALLLLLSLLVIPLPCLSFDFLVVLFISSLFSFYVLLLSFFLSLLFFLLLFHSYFSLPCFSFSLLPLLILFHYIFIFHLFQSSISISIFIITSSAYSSSPFIFFLLP